MTNPNFQASLVINAGVTNLNQLQQLINQIEQAGGEVSQLRQQSEQLDNTWHSLSTDEQTNQLQALANQAINLYQQTAIATQNMEQLFGVRTNQSIENEIRQINQSLATLHQRYQQGAISQAEFNRLSQAAQNRLNALQNEIHQTSQGINHLDTATNQATKALTGLQGLLTILGIGLGASELIQLADTYVNLESKIRLATDGGQAFLDAMTGIKQIANDTFTDLESTTTLFSKITNASQALNLSQQQILNLTQTINQAMQISGASTEEMNSAILQFSQGLSSGVLRGEEFNAIMENGGRLADALAQGLGVTKGQLRAMAEEGKLTASTVITAIQSQAKTIKTEFDSMPTTVGNAISQLKNNLLSLIGEIDGQLQQSSGLANFIQNIAQGLTNIDPSTTDALKQAFSQLAEIAKTLWGNLNQIGEMLGDLWGTFDGTAQAGEKVGFLTKIVQELAIFLGHVSDGIKGIAIVADGVFGAMIIGIWGVVSAWEKLTGKTTQTSDLLMKQGEQLLQRAKKKCPRI